MEAWIDEVEAELAPLTRFILPGGADAAAELHVCRTVCRRAERAVVGIGASDPSTSFAVRYLNRLADLLFVFARLENRLGGLPDVPWRESL